MNPPFFTVVVPTYNRAHMITATLDSLLAQTYADFEILIIDDGSTDDTEATVKPYLSERVHYLRKSNAERAAARNYGSARAQGSYVNFFDSDDLAYTNHLQVARDLLDQHGSPEWFHLGYNTLTPEGKELRRVDHFESGNLQASFPAGNPLSCNGVFLRTDVARDFPFQEDRALAASEDYHLWYRLAARFPLHFSNVVTSGVVEHDMRSVRVFNGPQLLRRQRLLLTLLGSDPVIQHTYGDRFYLTRCEVHSYLALHLAELPRWKVRSMRELALSLSASPRSCLKRRFLATLRNLLFRW
jgi:glycosyltransferase involved in cell wall biosynthesis